MYDIGLVTINRPTAALGTRTVQQVASRPKGAKKPNAPAHPTAATPRPTATSEHHLHLVGSVLHQQTYGGRRQHHPHPSPHPTTGTGENRDGTWRWYTEYVVPCPNGDTTARLPRRPWGDEDKGRFPLRTGPLLPHRQPHSDSCYGRRNATESVHRQYKRRAVRVPAYGHIRQTLYVLGFVTMHNAVAVQMAARAAGEPNVFGDKRQT